MKSALLIILMLLHFDPLFSQNEDSLGYGGKLHLSLYPGEKLRIDTVIVTGNKVTKESVILKELSFTAGDSITTEIIDFNKNRIYSTGLFTKVEEFLYIQNDKVVIDFNLNERWYLFPYPIVGIKDRDWDKFYYGLGVAHINFLGLNQKLFGSFALGYDPMVNLHYFNPDFFRKDIMFDLLLIHSKTKNKSLFSGKETKDFYEYWYNAQISIGNRLDIFKTLWVSFGYNQIKVTEKNLNKTITESGKDEYLSLNLSGELNTKDLNEYPMKGEHISIAVKKCGFGESEVDYSNLWIDLRKYIPIISNWSIGFRGFTGLTFGNRLPNYSHYFIGYSERVRGEFSKILEGENVAGFSTELRVPIFGPTYVVLPEMPIPQFAILRYGMNLAFFFDAGEVWDRYKFIWKKAEYGFGFGIHFLLPYSVIIRTEIGFNKNLKGQFIFDAGVSF